MRHLRNRTINRDANDEVKRTLRSRTVSLEDRLHARKRSLHNPRDKSLQKINVPQLTRQLQLNDRDEITSNITPKDTTEYLAEPSFERNATNDSESETTEHWVLPHNRSEANQLNPNIEFLYSREMNYESKYIQFLQSVKIKYNPQKFLNFNRLLSNDFVFHENNTHIVPHRYTKVDSEFRDVLYKSIYSTKKEYSIDRTKPETNDRKIFASTLAKSSATKYINSNILSTYTFDFKRETKSSPFVAKSQVKAICINNNEIKTLYPSPYPEHVNSESIIFICENCLSYCSSRFKYWRHKQKCSSHFAPPGSVIYRDKSIRLFEIDGRENQTYCRNLCLLSMLFLRSKTLFYEVDPFVFYVLYSENHLVGYFSKEKLNSTDYNLSCILTLPTFRRQGFGNLLMEFSYLLSRREFKVGTPEKPLSDLGLLTYRYYWKCKLAETLLNLRQLNFNGDASINISLKELSTITGFTATDVVFGLEQLDVLFTLANKSKFIIAIRNWSYIEDVNEKWRQKMIWHIKIENLLWKPLVFGPSCGINAVSNNSNLDSQTSKILKSIANVDYHNSDVFNEHLTVMIDHMTDDVADGQDMENVLLNKIKSRITCTEDHKTFTVDLNDHWQSCLIKPFVPGVKSKLPVTKSNYTDSIQRSISSGIENKNEDIDVDENMSTLGNIDESNSNDEDYNASHDGDGDGDDDDDEVDMEYNINR